MARLAKASMCTGYQLSNAEMRLLLERGAGAGACDSTTAYDACVKFEPRLSAFERSGLSPAAVAHVAALEARLRRLEAQCRAGGAAEQVSGKQSPKSRVMAPAAIQAGLILILA